MLLTRSISSLVRDVRYWKDDYAALYAKKYGTHHPGGILWVDVGKQWRTAQDITPVLQKMLVSVYGADVERHLNENEEITPQLVRDLLSCHPDIPMDRCKGPLLVI
jgi:hypothetical protein